MNSFFQITFMVLACLSVLMSVPLFLRLRWPAVALWIIKLYAGALSPLHALIGLLAVIAGFANGSIFTILIGLYVALVYSIYILRVTGAPHHPGSFENAFGVHWKNFLRPEQEKYFIPSRNSLILPAVPDPLFEQDIPFVTIPGTGRQLLCDIWSPLPGVPSSGLAFIYLHGSAFYFLDKDFGTRPFFRHLVAQGHVIMDVAYRLSPETGLMGMVTDVKRAIVWMKEHAGTYCINPKNIVVGGSSAGGHLALLAAYTSSDPRFTTIDLDGKDSSVSAVIALYASNDLAALYYHTNQHLTTRAAPGRAKKPVPTKLPGWVIKKMGDDYHRLGFDKGFENAGALAPLLGGHPEECPDVYALFSPATHVHRGCPPTLLVHGEDDIMAPANTTRSLYTRLAKEAVPTVLHILPQTDHAFDMVLPKISPSAHTAIYDVERFLALQVRRNQAKEKKQSKFVRPDFYGKQIHFK
jgi:acetyl esterase/lipase